MSEREYDAGLSDEERALVVTADGLRGLFVADNGLAPRGWVEVQRDDLPEDGGPALVSDAVAALLVAEVGGALGTACLLDVSSGALVPLIIDEADARERAEQMGETLGLLSCADTGECPRYITVVPEVVARAAGLL